MQFPCKRFLGTLAMLLAVGAPGQTGDVEKARGYIEKVVQGADSWVFQRSWRTKVHCAALNGMVEKTLNMQIRQAMSGLPFQPPAVKVEYFRLSRKAGQMSLRVELGGLPAEMEKSAESEGNKWLKTSPQAQVLQAFLSQPIGLPTFGRGSVLKGTEVAIRRDTDTAVDITLTPSAEANVKILGKLVQNIAVRIDKAQSVVQIVQANFTDGAMIQAKYRHEAVTTPDNQTFLVPVGVTFKQRGLEKLAQGIRLPETTEMRYEDFEIEAAGGE